MRFGRRNQAVFGILAALLLAGCGNVEGAERTGEGAAGIQGDTAGTQGDTTGTQGSGKGLDTGGFPAQMPEFSAKDLEGNTVTEEIFGEKDLTVLNIWGTFCGPCIREMPELGEWAESLPDNVQLIGLISDIDGEEDTKRLARAEEIVELAEADFVQIIANQDFKDVLSSVIGVPTTLFLDQEGNLVGEPILGADVDGYKQFVEEYLDARQE